MPNKNILAILCLLLFPVLLMAQSGKIAGKVTDLETHEPLIGATVKIVGTTLGASTDINGNYVILNVPIGTQTMECNYIGYKKITISNIRVISNQTTDRNFQLPSDVYKVEVPVEIFAQRPLVNTNQTNNQTVKNQEEIENLPVRGVEGIIALAANVVDVGGIHIGGSRSDQVDYRLDGIRVNDPVFGGRAATVINNAIEEISVQAGGYSAELGGATGGIITTQTRSGGRKLQISGEVITDAWNRPGVKSLGTYGYGINQYVLTVGGPITGPLKFFVAGQNTFQRQGVRFFEGYDLRKYYSLLRATPAWDQIYAERKYQTFSAKDYKLSTDPNAPLLFTMKDGKKVPLYEQNDPNRKQLQGPVGADGLAIPIEGIFDPKLRTSADVVPWEFPAGRTSVNAANQSWATQGNLTVDLNQINLRLSGSYGYNYNRGGVGMTSILAEQRATVSESENMTGGFKLTHMLSEKTFYELNVNYFRTFGVSYDPDIQANVGMYGDSIENAKYGYTLRGDGIQQFVQNAYDHSWLPYGYPLAGYGKSGYQSISGKLGFVHQIGRIHEIKFGGEIQTYTIRNYSPGRAFALKAFMRSNPTASAFDFKKNAAMNLYGYDMWGNKDDSETEGPKKPIFGSVYLLDKIELEDLVLNVGLRYDLIDTDSREFTDPNNIRYNTDGTIDESNFIDSKVAQTISPRLGFSFPVTDQTVFYAQYGKFVAQSRLRDVYMGTSLMAFQIQGGYAIGNPVGFGIRPERTTQYDIGFRQQLGENFAFDLSAFYRDIRGQVQMRQIAAAPTAQHNAYYAWVNGDFATTIGTSLKLTLRRVERLQASVDYTYSDARGTGSSPSTSFVTIWQAPTGVPYFPAYATYLDFDVSHKGTVNIDYRYNADDGPRFGSIYPLERVGLNMLFTFNSGHPYTRWDDHSWGNAHTPTEEINASRTPWQFNIDARLDKSFKVGPFDMNLYVWVTNLLNTRNVTSVFNISGSATDNGWLGSEEGQKQLAVYKGYGDVFSQVYRDVHDQDMANAGKYSAPRQIRLGFRFNF